VPKEEPSADLHAQQATTAKRWRPLSSAKIQGTVACPLVNRQHFLYSCI
jgi:hypothetical protein